MAKITAVEIAAHYLHGDRKALENILVPQIQHRLDLIESWEIQPGENILELGCGQGDCTISLAAVLGDNGHVTAVDPAPLDYGSPYTLGQAQSHLKASPFGSRITFVQADPVGFIRSSTEEYSTVVLAHCIWYFSTPSVLDEILQVLVPRVRRVCIAEYNLTATDPRSIPHLLAALTRVAVESHDPKSTSNIRIVLSPDAIDASAVGTGLSLRKRVVFTPNEGMLDGKWETDEVVAPDFKQRIHDLLQDEKERGVVVAMRDSVVRSLAIVRQSDKEVKTMDVCSFVYSTPTTSTA